MLMLSCSTSLDINSSETLIITTAKVCEYEAEIHKFSENTINIGIINKLAIDGASFQWNAQPMTQIELSDSVCC